MFWTFLSLIKALTLSFLLLVRIISPESAANNSYSVIKSGVAVIVKPALAKTIPPFLKTKASVNSLVSIWELI